MEKIFVSASITEQGTQQKQNQDYLGQFANPLGECFVVCDGEGTDGAMAARLAIDHIREFLESKHFDAPKEALRQALLFANEKLYQHFQEKNIDAFVACLVILVTDDRQFFYAHVGNVKLYSLSDQELTVFSANHPSDRGLGNQSNALIEVCYKGISLLKDDKLLLTTKGLDLPNEEIKALLQSDQDVQRIAQEIIHKAKEANTEDNTLHLLHFSKIKAGQKPNKALKVLKAWSFPLIIIIVLSTIFLMQHFRVKGINEEKNKRIEDSIATLKRNKIIQDSLSWVDAKPDTFLIHRIQRGESLGSIGSKYNISMDSIADWNGIENKSRINKNMKIKVKVKMVYTVRKPQTLEALYQERFERWKEKGVTIKSIIRANRFQKDKLQGTIPKGTQIIIPNLRRLYI